MATGMGKLAGPFSNGELTVSVSMKPATFTAFDTLEIGAGASFTASGVFGVASDQQVEVSGSLALGNPGVNTVTNAGLMEVFTGGSLTLAGVFVNTGTIEVHGGTLIANHAVSGSGVAMIAGGSLDLGSTFAQNVTFTGAGGVLQLARSRTYTGVVSGFSKSGQTSLDLLDIGFVSANEATYSGTKTGGVLTVTDGTTTAQIALAGNYLNATFVASSDGHGGVSVTDSPPMAPAAPSPGAFVAVMASFGATAGAGPMALHAHDEALRPLLCHPGTAPA